MANRRDDVVFDLGGAVRRLVGAIGKIPSVSFKLNKQENPFWFYATLVALFVFVLIDLCIIWVFYLNSIIS